MRFFTSCLVLFLFVLANGSSLFAQDSLRYYRLYLIDKGTPDRILLPSDPLYQLATEHLTERALKRRAKVLSADSLVSTADLPVYEEYLEAIRETGAEVVQMSRWLNAVMVLTDSITYETLRFLPFLDSASVMRTMRKSTTRPLDKRLVVTGSTAHNASPNSSPAWCIADHYGDATSQNELIKIDAAHRIGIAGEGVLVGILDAGFDWRSHSTLRDAEVIAEYDFVNNDGNAFDEEGQPPSEWHGTIVMSQIGAMLEDVLIGGAPHVRFALAKTENVIGERNLEEDNFVAGMEWLESLGVDVTNTSLGYTTFDAPEQGHALEELDGKTAFASRGLNYAVHLGVVCVVSAGNDYFNYRYVSVPGEADSAIAVAAVTPEGEIASFSSRGFGGRERIKPDVAAQGVKNYGADATGETRIASAQGTSLAAPMVTAGVALLLSARPDLTPWEVRTLLYRTSSHANEPDTAYGYGIMNVEEALKELSREQPIVGVPKVMEYKGNIAIAAWILNEAHAVGTSSIKSNSPFTSDVRLIVRFTETGEILELDNPQPVSGLATWLIPASDIQQPYTSPAELELTFIEAGSGAVIRQMILNASTDRSAGPSTLCEEVPLPVTSVATVTPNPFTGSTYIKYILERESVVSLRIYNTLGEEVAELLGDEAIGPGYHYVPFEPQGLPGGAYYYILSVDGERHSQHMIYLR